MKCSINKKDVNFKRLEKQLGEQRAIETILTIGEFEVPTITELKQKLSFPARPAALGVALFAKRLKRYNNKNNTSHSFTASQPKGYTATYLLKLHPSYIPKKIKSELDERTGYVKEFEHGVDTVIPEEKVAILGEGQYESYGDIFPSYEDALNNSDKVLAEKEQSISYKVDVAPLSIPVQLELFPNTLKGDEQLLSDIENLDLTPAFYQHIYDNSSKTKNKQEFDKEVFNIVTGMKSINSNIEILETLKCL